MGLRRAGLKLKAKGFAKRNAGDVLQLSGAVGLTVAASMVDGRLGVLVGSVLAVAAGVVLERS